MTRLRRMRAQLRGALPSDVLEPYSLPHNWPTCCQRWCRKPVARKNSGAPAKSCQPCLDRRAASCRRRRAALAAKGGCRRCAHRKRLEGDFLCRRCREDRDRERAQKRQDAIDAAAIDEFAAKPDRAHGASNLDNGVSERPPQGGTHGNGMVRPAPRRTASTASTGHNCVSNSTIRGNGANQ